MKKILVIASVMLLGMVAANAAGTAAGTQIDNSATLSYQVSGVNQTAVASNTDSFLVDNKIDFTVAHQDSTAVSVVPGQTSAVLTFTVANNGNKVQDFSLSSLANDGNPFGETDNFDATNVQVFVDSNGNGVYDSGTDTATFIDELAPDTNVTVFIVSDIPNTRVDGDVAEYTLIAQVAEGGASGSQGADITADASGTADNAMNEENVFADGAAAGTGSSADILHDGKHSDNDAYKVVTAKIDVTKTSCVIWDPVNTTTNPHRIPGAVVRYAIDVNNTGSAAATSASLSDTLSGDVTFGATTAGAPAAVSRIATETCNCTAPGASNGDTVSEAGGVVTANYGTVAAGTHECAYFDVTIN